MNDNENSNTNVTNVININDFLPQANFDSADFDSYIGENVEVYVDKPWWLDNYDMHDKFGFHEAIGKMTPEMLREMLKFRLNFLQEELNEAKSADSAEDIVDAMIDLCVVAIGTLDCYDVDAQEAWNRVHRANMSKERGIKPNRPNPLGLPDLCKPEGWVAPTHKDNHGILAKVDFTDFKSEFK